MTSEEILFDAEERMEKAVSVFRDELRGLRTGRATPALVDMIRVEYYGSPMPLNQIATVHAPDAQLITIQPFDPTVMQEIEKAIMSADLRGACPLSTNYPFLGMHRMVGDSDADNLDFATHNYTPHRPHEGDFCEISFFVDKDPVSGTFTLWRRRNPTLALDPLRRRSCIDGHRCSFLPAARARSAPGRPAGAALTAACPAG